MHPVLTPLLSLPPASVPSIIHQQTKIVKHLLDHANLKKAGWQNDRDLEMVLMAPRWRHFGEVLCGWGVIFAHCIKLGLLGFYYDLDIGGKFHNILTGIGLINLIQNLLTIMSGGCVWFGIPCPTWVWIARGHTHRSKNTHRRRHPSP